MLHTLRHSPWQCDIAELIRMLQAGDDLLLMQDGVNAALEGGRYLESLLNAPITIYVLEDDIRARGFSAQISGSVVRVDYTDFVRLTVKHSAQMAW
ncbi:tRNA 2-thiouridine synthesizing protein B [Enterobacter sp. BIGb0383]|uniref:sulfurtransferase complex subunit TusB n=1 Tax=unclassified Enterobacter TaxID=2608935 RepID=UPI000F468B7A|nr:MULTISPECIES: sulfurtransferase complex subunit TusB [unclassified Enterobacter]ROP56477.1 tRNA 2-thiouridine synthesizing protein B [Enterobacter sp. BIGb0383]ROS04543.1 tRNA 2-thiouridine synthesizing protein B [Enterobacter sp. BIGb0359]